MDLRRQAATVRALTLEPPAAAASSLVQGSRVRPKMAPTATPHLQPLLLQGRPQEEGATDRWAALSRVVLWTK